MRTNIEIDDQLMHQAMRSSGARTKKAAVEAGLRLLVRIHSQTAIRQLRGKSKVARRSERVSSGPLSRLGCRMTIVDTTVWIDYSGERRIRIQSGLIENFIISLLG